MSSGGVKASNDGVISLEIEDDRSVSTYAGDVAAGRPQGKGVGRLEDTSVYSGSWQDGKRHGVSTWGRNEWPCGSVYHGEWVGDFMQGVGTFEKPDGMKYTGSWLRGRKHGLGRQLYANGDCYTGLWKDDKKSGPGRYKWANKNEYAGEWLDNVMHGTGTLLLHTGERYDGEYRAGRMDGQGVYTFAHGAVFDGFWSKGLKHGVGLYYRKGRIDEKATTGQLRPSTEAASTSTVLPSTTESSVELRAADAGRRSRGGNLLPISDDAVLDPMDGSAEPIDVVSAPTHRRRPSLPRIDHAVPEMFIREYDCGALIRNTPIQRREVAELLARMIRRNKDAKNRHKAPDRGMPKAGEIIQQGHRSYELMLDLQLGIAWSVGKVSLEPCPAEFPPEAFTHRQNNRFPRSGSESTPPHPTHDFTWIDYCPMVFRKLRDVFGVDAGEYILSLCGKQALREQRSSGKSNALFFMSHDDRFLIKTMRHGEVKTFLKMLPLYFEHMCRNPHCLLTQFYGLYRVSTTHLGRNSRKIRFIVMGNIFNENVHIHRRYDLKGSTQGRTCKHPDVDGINLKDLDLDIHLELEPDWQAKLVQQLQADCGLLRNCRVMDYSLLLGIHFKGAAEDGAGVSKTLSLARDKLAEAHDGYLQVIHSWNLPEQQVKDVEFLVNAQLTRSRRTRNVLQVLGSRKEHEQDSRDAITAFELGEKQVRLGLGMSGVAVHKQTGRRQDVVVYFGIIDFMQNYSTLKKAEHVLKSVRYKGSTVSVVNPDFYAQRFTAFMSRIFSSEAS